jgi:hypothetical protein
MKVFSLKSNKGGNRQLGTFERECHCPSQQIEGRLSSLKKRNAPQVGAFFLIKDGGKGN